MSASTEFIGKLKREANSIGVSKIPPNMLLVLQPICASNT